MQLQQTFWQHKLSPKQLIIDWDKFIKLFDQWILQTISIKLNQTQKNFIKSFIDPQSKNIVYKNSYLLFIKNFWDLPSNRTKLLKGQVNLSKMPKLQFISDINDQDNVLVKVQYIPDTQPEIDGNIGCNKTINNVKQQIFELRKNKIYSMDPKFSIISQKIVSIEHFLTFGRSQSNDICIDDCQFINQQHLKLIKMVTKRKKQKKPFYMMDDDQDKKNQNQTHWYIRDVSRSNRLQYLLANDTKYVVMRSGLTIKIGLTDQYQIQIIKATPNDINQDNLKQLQTLLNSDRINYLGQIDPSVPQKFIIDIPIAQVKHSDIQYWFNKGFYYQEKQQISIKKKIDDPLGQQQELPLCLRLVDKITRQVKEFKFIGESVKIGRKKQNKIVIDKVAIRDIQCEFVCITGVWMLKNVKQNYVNQSKKDDKQLMDKLRKKLKIKDLCVGLATQNSLNCLESSNRIQLSSGCRHEFRGRNFILSISFPNIKK